MSQKTAFTPSQIIRSANHARENNERFYRFVLWQTHPNYAICTSITEKRATTSR